LGFVWSFGDDTLAALNPTMVVVSRDPDGRWFVTFAVDTADPEPAPRTGHMVGVDLGVKDFAVTSDGERIATPKHLQRKARNLARYQRMMCRKQKGSNNRGQARKKVARAHRKVGDARQDFLHRTTTNLVRGADMIAIEDLNVAGMTASARGTIDNPGRHVRAKAGLNRRLLDAAWGQFRRQLEYNTDRAAKSLFLN
jgi:putative transposase